MQQIKIGITPRVDNRVTYKELQAGEVFKVVDSGKVYRLLAWGLMPLCWYLYDIENGTFFTKRTLADDVEVIRIVDCVLTGREE